MEYPRDKLRNPGARRLHRRDRRSRARGGRALRRAGTQHQLSPSHQSRRLQGGSARRRTEVATGEFVAIFDADFTPHCRLADEGHPPLRRSRDRHGADALDAPEPQLLVPDRGRGHPARRPLRAGARRPLARGRVLQLQRHRRNVAAQGHRRRRRLGARHADRRHRPELPLAA